MNQILLQGSTFCARIGRRGWRMNLSGWADRSFVQNHFFTGFGLAHVIIGERNGSLDLLILALAKCSCAVASNDVPTDACLNQKWVASRIFWSEIEIFCHRHSCKNCGVTLHFKKIVDVIIGEIGNLNRRLSSSFSDCTLFWTNQSEIAELVSPKDN